MSAGRTVTGAATGRVPPGIFRKSRFRRTYGTRVREKRILKELQRQDPIRSATSAEWMGFVAELKPLLILAFVEVCAGLCRPAAQPAAHKSEPEPQQAQSSWLWRNNFRLICIAPDVNASIHRRRSNLRNCVARIIPHPDQIRAAAEPRSYEGAKIAGPIDQKRSLGL